MTHIHVGAVQFATSPMTNVQDLAVKNENAQAAYVAGLQDE